MYSVYLQTSIFFGCFIHCDPDSPHVGEHAGVLVPVPRHVASWKGHMAFTNHVKYFSNEFSNMCVYRLLTCGYSEVYSYLSA